MGIKRWIFRFVSRMVVLGIVSAVTKKIADMRGGGRGKRT